MADDQVMPLRREFRVTVELPRQELSVFARTESEAAFQAWQMIGYTGVRHFGMITAERVTGARATSA